MGHQALTYGIDIALDLIVVEAAKLGFHQVLVDVRPNFHLLAVGHAGELDPLHHLHPTPEDITPTPSLGGTDAA